MEQTKINHSPLITAVEKFVEETIKRQRRWKGYWVELVELLNEMQGKHPANTALPSDPISLNLVPT